MTVRLFVAYAALDHRPISYLHLFRKIRHWKDVYDVRVNSKLSIAELQVRNLG